MAKARIMERGHLARNAGRKPAFYNFIKAALPSLAGVSRRQERRRSLMSTEQQF